MNLKLIYCTVLKKNNRFVKIPLISTKDLNSPSIFSQLKILYENSLKKGKNPSSDITMYPTLLNILNTLELSIIQIYIFLLIVTSFYLHNLVTKLLSMKFANH